VPVIMSSAAVVPVPSAEGVPVRRAESVPVPVSRAEGVPLTMPRLLPGRHQMLQQRLLWAVRGLHCHIVSATFTW
jgi:hypothetical protein